VEMKKRDPKFQEKTTDSIFSEGFSVYDMGISYPLSFKGVKYYKDLYKNVSVYPSLSYRYFLGGKNIAFGFGFHIAFYSDIGYTAVANQRGKAEGSLETSSQRTQLSVLPYQFLFLFHLSPVADKVVFDAWAGYQELYWEEVRSVAQSEEESISYLNKGWNSHVVVGASIGIRINDLDQESSLSLSKSMSIDNIFFAPFYEIAFPLKFKKLLGNRKISKSDFRHMRVGVKIVFETS